MEFATSDVDELWKANYDVALRHLWTDTKKSLQRTEAERIWSKARHLADEQTKKQVNDPDVWQQFSDSRARQPAKDRKFGKMTDPFDGKSARSGRRKSAIESARPPA
jgi:hypothetical protein